MIFFEENKNIEDSLKLMIVFGDEKEFLYEVDVMKYWEYNDKDLIEKKMYPLIPLQLFNLRKKLNYAKKKNDINKIKELSIVARNLAEKLAIESKELFDQDEILGEDFHSMLLAIQNLIEYLNRNYIDDENLEKEVNIMTKSLSLIHISCFVSFFSTSFTTLTSCPAIATSTFGVTNTYNTAPIAEPNNIQVIHINGLLTNPNIKNPP